MARYSIGLDFGTHAVRALLVDTSTGREAARATWQYPHGAEGVIRTDAPDAARQHPSDYLQGTETVVQRVLRTAGRSVEGFSPEQVCGLGVAGSGSTVLPVGRTGQPLALSRPFEDDPDAMAWLWSDRIAVKAAEDITAMARKMRPQYLAKCGGSYGPGNFYSKIVHCMRNNTRVFDAAFFWVELTDWIPAMLTGTQSPESFQVNICAAGHKGLFHPEWGGYPDEKFMIQLDRRLGDLRTRMRFPSRAIHQPVGKLIGAWAKRLGLAEGLPVAAGALDTHLAAVGAGICPGRLVKILGDTSVDMTVVRPKSTLPDIPGLVAIVPDGMVPGAIGLEAGLPAVANCFRWFTDYMQPAGRRGDDALAHLTEQAAGLAPGASGLLALDWMAGNRTVLGDPRLTGLMVGQTLQTTPAEVFRALMESTAFATQTVLQRLEQYHVSVQEIVFSDSYAEKQPLLMQIYADVMDRPMRFSRSRHAAALGAAIAGAVVGGAHPTIPHAQKAMTARKKKKFTPDPAARDTYKRLYRIWRQLHDAFGTTSWKGSCQNVMKDLLAIQAEARQA